MGHGGSNLYRNPLPQPSWENTGQHGAPRRKTVHYGGQMGHHGSQMGQHGGQMFKPGPAPGANDAAKPILRMITWNVADNKGMNGRLNVHAMDAVLGLNVPQSKLADIYAIGLQENCWMCNTQNMRNIANAFRQRLMVKSFSLRSGTYEVVGIQGTRMFRHCETECKMNRHGTTAIVVVAKKGIVWAHKQQRFTQGCSAMRNVEKGVAYMQLHLANGKKVCVATSHLDSESPQYRRNCLKNFFAAAEREMQWISGCDFHFLSGDFNVRTAEKATPGQLAYFRPQSNFNYLKPHDELAGNNAFGYFGRSDTVARNLLGFINSVQWNVFKESPIRFSPTFRVDYKGKEKSCRGRNPCYTTDRPLSWTDRILYTAGTIKSPYNSIQLTSSDHHPVYQEFVLYGGSTKARAGQGWRKIQNVNGFIASANPGRRVPPRGQTGA